MRKVLITTLILTIAFHQNIFAQYIEIDSVLNQMSRLMEGVKNEYHLPSIVMAVIHDNEIIYKNAIGYSDVEKQAEAKTFTKYPIMSITKVFESVMLVQLSERGLIGLNDDVKKYIPEYKISLTYPGNHTTSLLQLATHNSGLPRESPANATSILSHYQYAETNGKSKLEYFCTKDEFLKSLQFIEFEHMPYEYNQYSSYYSNVGCTMLGIALERASQKEFSEYMSENIFKPLKMNNTGFVQSINDKERLNLSSGYIYNKSTNTYVRTPYLLTDSYYYCGGMYSTAEDLAKFISSQLDYDNNPVGQIITPDGIRMMRYLNLGWQFQWYPEYPMINHGGSYLGYRSYIALVPELKLGWVILANQYDYKENIDFGKINNRLRELLMPLYKNEPAKAYASSEKVDFNKYVGSYSVADKSMSMDISSINDTLHYDNATYSPDNNVLIPIAPNIYKEKAGFKYEFIFVLDNKNEICKLKMGDLIWYKN